MVSPWKSRPETSIRPSHRDRILSETKPLICGVGTSVSTSTTFLNSIDRIESYIPVEQFFAPNSLVQDAVMRNLEIIGEGATHLPQETRDALPEVHWRDVIDHCATS